MTTVELVGVVISILSILIGGIATYVKSREDMKTLETKVLNLEERSRILETSHQTHSEKMNEKFEDMKDFIHDSVNEIKDLIRNSKSNNNG
jgi:uncharacterized protein YcbK (DUF882 family)